MEQLALTLTSPGIRHNRPPEPLDPAEGEGLADSYAALLARLHEFELGCARVPDPLEGEQDAALLTDFIAQCRAALREAERSYKREKAPLLIAGRIVDGFFRRRCHNLNAALAPAVAWLKSYREEVAAAERRQHEEAQRHAAEEAARAAAEAKEHRAEAERLARDGQSFEERHRGAEAAVALAEAAGQLAFIPFEPTRIRSNYATAFVRRSWSFEVVDLDQVPREYMSLDVPVVREAIAQRKVRHIPGLRIFQTEGLRVRATTRPRSYRAPSEGEQAGHTGKSADAATRQSSDQRSSGPQMLRRRRRASSASDPLVVSIKPIWGDQKVLRYYRQALASLQPHDAAEIANFRAAHAAIEARLWRKLPQRMEEIDFLYGGLRVLPEAREEGT